MQLQRNALQISKIKFLLLIINHNHLIIKINLLTIHLNDHPT